MTFFTQLRSFASSAWETFNFVTQNLQSLATGNRAEGVRKIPKIYFSEASMKAIEEEVETGKVDTLTKHLQSFAEAPSAQPILQHYPELAIRFLPLISSQHKKDAIAPLVTKVMMQFIRFQVCGNALRKNASKRTCSCK